MTGFEEEIQAALAEGAARSARLGPGHRELWAALSDAVRGGKRFRPALVAIVHDALGGSAGRPVARVGAALEILHTAFVVHDDVIDGDEVRRGRPNVSGTFTAEARERGSAHEAARNYGVAAGLLAGDLALITATRMIARCGAPADATGALLGLLEDAVHASAAGELADVGLSLPVDGRAGTVQDAVRVAELKTAVYSFCLPLQAGAVLAGAGEGVVESLAEVGRDLGIGFQLLDDLLGVFGDPARTGKGVLSDLREGKPTALIAHARATSVWPELGSLVGNPALEEPGAERARELLTACGARAEVTALAEDRIGRALERAGRAPLTPGLQAALSRCAGELTRAATSALVPDADSGSGGARTTGARAPGDGTSADPAPRATAGALAGRR